MSGKREAPAAPARFEALLLDMDGVLAEVSESFRAAILGTAKAFGAQVTVADVVAAKAAGGANNDWVLTHNLVRAKLGSTADGITYEQVKAKFEELYQGNPARGVPGLCETETLICEAALLEELGRRTGGKMAIVTGRPRGDCMKFLKTHGLTHLFDVHVCMEDGPPKPDPFPCAEAIRQLGVAPAACLMVGDTPDDVRSARAAGCSGLGVRLPHDYARAVLAGDAGGDAMLDSLRGAGAIDVITPGLMGLLNYFPREAAAPMANGNGAGGPSAKRARTAAEGEARVGEAARHTKETQISCRVDLDGTGKADVNTGLGFLDHMLSALAKHSRMDITLHCSGDLEVDDHHTAEDCGLALGEAFDKALGTRKGIARWGFALCPLDEALSRAVVDISSRPHSVVDLGFRREMIGTISTEMLTHVLESFASAARICLHVHLMHGDNDHHKAESGFKAVAVAVRAAVALDAGAGVPSTKGVLA
uniref:Imidazoleglycerol-phosphate dehydratase n=1 Tax=Phaeomonas parva TaxID=124430 RepID=A0A7S1U7T5_9STRA